MCRSSSSQGNLAAKKRRDLKEMKREKKWKEMMACWDEVKAGRRGRESQMDPKFQRKLRQRILRGVPNRIRGQVWAKLAQTGRDPRSLCNYDPVCLSCFRPTICTHSLLSNSIHICLHSGNRARSSSNRSTWISNAQIEITSSSGRDMDPSTCQAFACALLSALCSLLCLFTNINM